MKVDDGLRLIHPTLALVFMSVVQS